MKPAHKSPTLGGSAGFLRYFIELCIMRLISSSTGSSSLRTNHKFSLSLLAIISPLVSLLKIILCGGNFGRRNREILWRVLLDFWKFENFQLFYFRTHDGIGRSIGPVSFVLDEKSFPVTICIGQSQCELTSAFSILIRWSDTIC